jgi:superfamily II DNA or RNA helicase
MAGLIIKELKLRGLAKKILIICPGHLKEQWRRELYEKFNENFTVIDRGLFSNSYGASPWEKENQAITSIDFAKQADILNSLKDTKYCLVIVDEAHKMSAYRYGKSTKKTDRYALGQTISKISENLLFLTATPHNGNSQNFRLFLDLLAPNMFSNVTLLNKSLNGDNPLYIRRLKEDLIDFDGKKLFLKRHTHTLTYQLKTSSESEFELYDNLSRYIKEQYNKALSKGNNRNIAFAMVILQRRFASSTYALLNSLLRRKNKLEYLLNMVENESLHPYDYRYKGIDIQEYDEKEYEEQEQEDEIWETLSVSENRYELKKEIDTLYDLIESCKTIIHSEKEIKVRELKKAMEDLNKKYPEKKDKKILIFTESKDTLDYLNEKISSWGYDTCTIHGGMKLDKRREQEQLFKDSKDVMIATEAAGEGINLQFCHLMVNYDIPWNPNRLEQRLGRIHRYGQTKEVYCINLVADDTREGLVLKTLLNKMDQIRDELGEDKVFDILGDFYEEKNLSQLLAEVAANSKSEYEVISEIENKLDSDYLNKMRDTLNESLAVHNIDYTRLRNIKQMAFEQKFIPEYIEEFFKKAYSHMGGKLSERISKEGIKYISIDNIPSKIKKTANLQDNIFTGTLNLNEYSKVTFNKDIHMQNPEIRLFSFGDPLFESVLSVIERDILKKLEFGAFFEDPDGNMDGYITYIMGSIKDGLGNVVGRKIYSYYISNDKITEVPVSILWDLSIKHKTGECEDNIQNIKNKAEMKCREDLREYLLEISMEKKRQVNIKERYGQNSLETNMSELDSQIIELEERKDRGELVDLALRNARERMESYEDSLKKLKDEIEREKNITMQYPEHITTIRVGPAKSSGMSRNDETEKLGMDYVMQYELMNKRVPEDVSLKCLGYDIRSKGEYGNYRYIEVKSRSELGEIIITKNEWINAEKFGENYYLYVVYNSKTNPELKIIKNPYKHLKPTEIYESVRYLVSKEDILNGS